VGIQARVVTYEWSEYLAKIDAGEHALALLGWIPDVPDPDDYLFALFGGATQQWAASGPPDQRLYEMLLRARAEGDLRVRQQLYYEANAILHGLVPGVPLMHHGVLSASRQGLVGYNPAPQFDRWSVASYVTDTLTIGSASDAQGLDVADETDAESLSIGAQIYEGLVAFEPGTTHLLPGLAERWEVSRDGLEWTFYLRRGAKFHDGSDFNADAVLFNIDRIWDRNHPYRAGHTGEFAYFAWFLGGFKGETEPQPVAPATP
jgi:ABC-type transport system substrate-binding protein